MGVITRGAVTIERTAAAPDAPTCVRAFHGSAESFMRWLYHSLLAVVQSLKLKISSRWLYLATTLSRRFHFRFRGLEFNLRKWVLLSTTGTLSQSPWRITFS